MKNSKAITKEKIKRYDVSSRLIENKIKDIFTIKIGFNTFIKEKLLHKAIIKAVRNAT